jgi:two-component system sensor kinase FixL
MEKKNCPGTILIVDDEQNLLRLLERILSREKFRIVTASSGAEAVSWLATHTADLLLLDLNLPDMSGKEVITILVEKKQIVPFIIITGLGDVRIAVEIMKMGAVDYLVKDTDFLEMVPLVVHGAIAQLETKRKLAAAEEQVRLIQSVVQQGFNAVLITTAEIPDARVVYVNPAFTEMTGYRAEELVGEKVSVLQEFTGALARLRQDPNSEPGFLDGTVAYRREQAEQWVEWRIGPVHDPAGKITHWVAIMRDVTLRKRAESALRESEERYRNLVELSPDAIFLSCNDEIVFINQAGLRFFGAAAPDELLGKSASELIHPSYRNGPNRLEAMAATGSPALRQEQKWIRLDGSVVDAEVTAASSSYHGKPAVQVIVRDISERKRLEKEILDISEMEQRRIGQDLHDGLCQHLAGIQLMSQVLEQKLADTSGEVAATAAEIAKLVRQSITHSRDLVKGLSPVLHHEEGLASALKELAETNEKLFNVSILFQNDRGMRISDQTVATHLYRIAQEALNNSIKHGKPKQIRIELMSADGQTILRMQDDGIGFPKKLRNRKGMGLQIMKYRASLIGGTLAIESKAGNGAAVICSIQKQDNGQLSRKKTGL